MKLLSITLAAFLVSSAVAAPTFRQSSELAARSLEGRVLQKRNNVWCGSCKKFFPGQHNHGASNSVGIPMQGTDQPPQTGPMSTGTPPPEVKKPEPAHVPGGVQPDLQVSRPSKEHLPGSGSRELSPVPWVSPFGSGLSRPRVPSLAYGTALSPAPRKGKATLVGPSSPWQAQLASASTTKIAPDTSLTPKVTPAGSYESGSHLSQASRS